MIVTVNEASLAVAARIHALSWQGSHRAFCSEEFVRRHTVEHQQACLRAEMQAGKRVYLLVRHAPVGVVSVGDSLIENLYVLPAEQNKGCGTELLRFAVSQCAGLPRLYVLDNNLRAQALYVRYGFRLSGRSNPITETLSELEMVRQW